MKKIVVLMFSKSLIDNINTFGGLLMENIKTIIFFVFLFTMQITNAQKLESNFGSSVGLLHLNTDFFDKVESVKNYPKIKDKQRLFGFFYEVKDSLNSFKVDVKRSKISESKENKETTFSNIYSSLSYQRELIVNGRVGVGIGYSEKSLHLYDSEDGVLAKERSYSLNSFYISPRFSYIIQVINEHKIFLDIEFRIPISDNKWKNHFENILTEEKDKNHELSISLGFYL